MPQTWGAHGFTAASVRGGEKIEKKGSKQHRRDKTESEYEPSCPDDGIALAGMLPGLDEGTSPLSSDRNRLRHSVLPK